MIIVSFFGHEEEFKIAFEIRGEGLKPKLLNEIYYVEVINTLIHFIVTLDF